MFRNFFTRGPRRREAELGTKGFLRALEDILQQVQDDERDKIL